MELIEPLNIGEIRFILQRVLKNKYYTANNMIVQHYKYGVVATHEKLIIPAVEVATNISTFSVKLHVKVQPKQIDFVADFSIGESVFWKEINFYENIVTWLIHKYRFEKFMPSVYVATGGRLVMEDLFEKGFYKRNIFDNFKYVKSVIETLAKFHCCSIVTEAILSRIEKTRTTMLDKFETGFDELMFNDWSTIGKWYRVGINITCYLAENLYKFDKGEVRAALLCAGDLTKESPVHRNVICHGDLRKENLVYIKQKHNRVVCFIQNFSLMRYAPLALDILQFLYLHTSKMFRSKHEQEMLAIYHMHLADISRRYVDLPEDLRIDLPDLPSVKAAVNDLRLFGPAVATVYTSLSLLSKSHAIDFIRQPMSPANFVTQDLLNNCYCKVSYNNALKEQLQELISETIAVSKDTIGEASGLS